MKELSIKYNPYRLRTEITIDGKAPAESSRLNVGDKRLQEWIEELPRIIFDEYKSKEFQLTFTGTFMDYEDVSTVVTDALRQNFKIELKHIPPSKEIGDREAKIDEIFKKIQEGPFDELKTDDVKKAFEMAKSDDFEVTVVATVSSGKSTLINAFLGKKIMPIKNAACTATISRIKDNDQKSYSARVYDADSRLIKEYSDLTLDIMKELNENENVSEIHIEGDIPFVSAKETSLVLVDTPGPNNSQNQKHKDTTYRAMSKSSKALVIYVLNGTQLQVNDDNKLLNYIAESMKVHGKQSRDRFIFVLNKLDRYKYGDDSVKENIKSVRTYLKKHGIENANIYPASAMIGMEIRDTLAEVNDLVERYDEDEPAVHDAKREVNDYIYKFKNIPDMRFDEIAPLTPSVRKQIKEDLDKAEKDGDIKAQALIHCGVIPIEKTIDMYVQKYAKTAKIKNIADTFLTRLESASSFEKTKQEISNNTNKRNEIAESIDKLKKKVESGNAGQDFKVRLDKLDYSEAVSEQIKEIRTKAQEKVTKLLKSLSKTMSQAEAKNACREFGTLVEDLQIKMKVDIEDMIADCVTRKARALLLEYSDKIKSLTEEIGDMGDLNIDVFEMMEGEIDIKSDYSIDKVVQEALKTGSEKVETGDHKEYKEVLGIRRKVNELLDNNFFVVKYDVVKDFMWKDISYVTLEDLAQKYFAPVETDLIGYGNSAVEFAADQTEKIKKAFEAQFEKLDKVVLEKIEELKKFTEDGEEVKKKIEESKGRLEWLEGIMKDVDNILDI